MSRRGAVGAPTGFVPGAGVQLAVYDDGPAERPAVVVAHGVGSSATFVREAFGATTATAGWRLVAYDLRGHGASSPVTDPVEHRLARHVADLHAVARSVAAEAVAGVSLGAHAAVAYAAAGGPVTAVAACLPAWTGRAVPAAGPHAHVAARVEAAGIDAMLAGVAADAGMPPWLRHTLLRDWSAHDPASLAAALTALDGGLAPTEADLRGLPVPLATVGWAGDPGHPLAVARAWAAWAPRGRLVTTTMDAVGQDRGALGAAACTGLLAVTAALQA